MSAIQLGRAWGARVIATAGSEEKREFALRQGAEYVLDYRGENVVDDWVDEVKALTEGRGADVIYDPVGGDVFDESVRCIAFDGRLLVIGFTSGRIPSIDVNMPLIKGFSVMGVRAGEYGRRFPERGRENLDAIWRLADEGRIRPRVHAQLPLGRWREAFELLARRQVIGKAVLIP
jgi:NADPH2:quinone reductase